MDQSLLNDFLIIIGLSIFVVFLFNKLKLPSIVGFLLTGMIAGPYGLKLIQDAHSVEQISEIGVILIMFSIGMEFSLKKLLNIKRNIFLGGGLQVVSTIILVILILAFSDFKLNQSIFVSFLVALSSTALIMKLLLAGGATDSPQGRISLSIAIFQDLAILPMILLAPLLAGGDINIGNEILMLFLKIFSIGLFLFVSIKFIMPNLIFQIAKTRVKELFILVVIAICGVTVWLSSISGISLALGAFMAGLIISETDYSSEALGIIEPFREVFASFFFVSVGMLLNLSFLIDNFYLVITIVSLLILVKFISGFVAAYALTKSLRVSIVTSLLIAQIGEFAFVLAAVGFASGLLDNFTYQIFLSTTIISITLTPFLLRLGEYFAGKLAHRDDSTRSEDDSKLPESILSNHLIIIGYGLNGRNLALAASFANINYLIIEMNPVTVREQKALGKNIIFGDATKENVLEHAFIERAKVVVSTIPDPSAERALVVAVKRKNPDVYLIIRTRYDREMTPLYSLGADEVIPEEFETSIELFNRVLNKYNIDEDEIMKFTNKIRGNRYELFTKINKNNKHKGFLSKLSDLRTYTVRIKKSSILIGKSLIEANLRENYSITILAIERDGDVTINPSPTFVINEGDSLLLFGENSIMTNIGKTLN